RAEVIDRLEERLLKVVPPDWQVYVQEPIILSTSEPKPDLTVTVGPEGRSRKGFPRGRDVGIVIEVLDNSRPEVRGLKRGIYAGARIPFYWIVNLVERRIEVYSQPRAGQSPFYQQRMDYRAGSIIRVILGEEDIGRVCVSDVLPEPVPDP